MDALANKSFRKINVNLLKEITPFPREIIIELLKYYSRNIALNHCWLRGNERVTSFSFEKVNNTEIYTEYNIKGDVIFLQSIDWCGSPHGIGIQFSFPRHYFEYCHGLKHGLVVETHYREKITGPFPFTVIRTLHSRPRIYKKGLVTGEKPPPDYSKYLEITPYQGYELIRNQNFGNWIQITVIQKRNGKERKRTFDCYDTMKLLDLKWILRTHFRLRPKHQVLTWNNQQFLDNRTLKDLLSTTETPIYLSKRT